MKPTALHIERWLSNVEATLVPPPLRVLQVKVYAARDKEKALALLAARAPDAFADRTVEDINWSDDLAAAQAEAVAEHIAAHPEDAGRTVKDFRWVVHEIVLEPQEPIEDELTAKEAEVEKIEDDIVVPADASDKDAAVSETPPALNVLSFDCSARSKPWRPVHQRPARDQRRPTWKKWER
jgi:hypothetical protein